MGLEDESPGGLIDYVNVPPTIGMAISGNPALLASLSTVLGLEDLHDILEVKRVDAHNARIMRKAAERD